MDLRQVGSYQDLSGRDRRSRYMDDLLVYVQNALHFLVEATSEGRGRRGKEGDRKSSQNDVI